MVDVIGDGVLDKLVELNKERIEIENSITLLEESTDKLRVGLFSEKNETLNRKNMEKILINKNAINELYKRRISILETVAMIEEELFTK